VVADDSPDGAIWTLALHPDGMHFYGGTTAGIRRWRVEDGREVGKQTGMDMNAISVSRDGKWIVCGFEKGASVWDAELQRKGVEVKGTKYVGAVDASPESTRFATGTATGTTSIWSITTGERLVGPLQHDTVVKGIKFSGDGGHIATACKDSIHIFDSYSGDQLIAIKNQLDDSYPITPIVWSSDGGLFAVSEGGTIKSFDTATGSQVAEWNIHSEDLTSVALSTDNKSIASPAGHSVSFWDTSTRTQLGNVSEDDDVQSIALSPDGTRLATGGRDNKTITIWNLSDILPESYLPITVSTTFPLLGRAITFVYQSKTLVLLEPRM
jgi:WD40 repeat protein